MADGNEDLRADDLPGPAYEGYESMELACPAERSGHVAVGDGRHMFVWGGYKVSGWLLPWRWRPEELSVRRARRQGPRCSLLASCARHVAALPRGFLSWRAGSHERPSTPGCSDAAPGSRHPPPPLAGPVCSSRLWSVISGRPLGDAGLRRGLCAVERVGAPREGGDVTPAFLRPTWERSPTAARPWRLLGARGVRNS